MFENLSLTQLPRALQDLVQQTTATDQAKREKRRSLLLREIRAEEVAAGKETPLLAAAADRAVAQREKAYATYQAAVDAECAAIQARTSRGLARDAVINSRLSELRSLADPRIAEFSDELFALERETALTTIDNSIETHPAPPGESRRIAARIYSNAPSVGRRLAAIREAQAAAMRLREVADVDVGEAIAELRASVSAFALEKELAFDDKVGEPVSHIVESVPLAAVDDPSYVDAWRPR